jgi:hypothetical protein
MFCADETRRDRVYGGVRLDLEGAGKSVASVARGEVEDPVKAVEYLGVAGLLIVVDLPLCLIADTFDLPRTLRIARERRQKTQDKPAPPATPEADLSTQPPGT